MASQANRLSSRSRWGPPAVKVEGIGFKSLPTAVTANMTSEQLDAYITHFRIVEITDMLKTGHAATASTNKRRRSASPEPEYDNSGRRTNTRQQRYLHRLQQEQQRLISQAVKTIPNYSPPPGYVPQTNILTAKVYVPAVDFPDVNFIGQILGPRGSTHKSLKEASNANIMLRGKGSVKEGKGQHAAHETEPLHCLITAKSQAALDKAKHLIQQVIDNAISSSDEQNERKKKQLRDLAKMNGTFRDDERLLPGRQLEYPGCDAGSSKEPDPIRDADFDREYNSLLCDIGADSQATEAKLPPWRLTRNANK